MEAHKKQLESKKRKNIIIYFFYKMFSFDLLFYYAISFLYLNEFKGIPAAQIILADAFYPIFKVLFQIPSTIFVERHR